MVRMVAPGLMLLAVLMLSAAQGPVGTATHLQSLAGHHHVMAAQVAGQASVPCADHCNLHGHGLACCIATCALASASLPTAWGSNTLPPDTLVSYRAAVTGSRAGLAPDPALRPPERIG
jgi:hypothetical protein